jgi:hypothetical protein
MCNCGKGKKQLINNTKNQQVLNEIKSIYDSIVKDRNIEEIDDLDWAILYNAWKNLYPNASSVPTKEGVIKDIETSMQFLKVTYK